MVIRDDLGLVDKGAVSDEVLRRFVRRSGTGSTARSSLSGEFRRVQRVQVSDEGLDEGALHFLQDVIEHGNDGVKVRFKRLGLSVGRGIALKEELIESGWLECQVVSVGRTRKLLLRLTRDARRALGLDDKEQVRGSLAHEYWKRFYARRFGEQGYRVELEAPRRHGTADVAARRGRGQVAIEVGTGQSNAVENARQDLLSGFDKVTVVATSESAMSKVKRESAHAGLTIPNRVSVVLRDKMGEDGQPDRTRDSVLQVICEYLTWAERGR